MSEVTTKERSGMHEHDTPKHEENAGKPWDVDVDVYLDSVGPPASFRIESYLQPQGNGNLVFHNRGRPGFNVNFHLHDETDSGYQFPRQPNVDQAVWSQLGSVCPTSGVWEVFVARQVKDQGMTLVAFNANPEPAQGIFQYTLNVTNDDGASYVPLDPGGNNMNGSSSS